MKKQDNAIIGIYKITSPSGKVYIGQSINIAKRKSDYEKIKCKRQLKIYFSLKNYGPENHIFEILEECYVEQLNERESFYKQQFINEHGWSKALFCEIYDLGSGGPLSEETKRKIGDANRGRKNPKNKEWCDKISKANRGRKFSEDRNKKIGKANKGNKGPLGYKYTEEQKQNMRKPKLTCKKGKEHGNFGKKVSDIVLSKKYKSVLQFDKQYNLVKEWGSLKEASLNLKIKSGDISNVCREKQKTAGGFIWKFKN